MWGIISDCCRSVKDGVVRVGKKVAHFTETLCEGVSSSMVPPALFYFLCQNVIYPLTGFSATYVYFPFLFGIAGISTWQYLYHRTHPNSVKDVEYMIRGYSFLRAFTATLSAVVAIFKGSPVPVILGTLVAISFGVRQAIYSDLCPKRLTAGRNRQALTDEDAAHHSPSVQWILDHIPKKLLGVLGTYIVRNFKLNGTLMLGSVFYYWFVGTEMPTVPLNVLLGLLGAGSVLSAAETVAILKCENGERIRHFDNKLFMAADAGIGIATLSVVLKMLFEHRTAEAGAWVDLIIMAPFSGVGGYFSQRVMTKAYTDVPGPKAVTSAIIGQLKVCCRCVFCCDVEHSRKVIQIQLEDFSSGPSSTGVVLGSPIGERSDQERGPDETVAEMPEDLQLQQVLLEVVGGEAKQPDATRVYEVVEDAHSADSNPGAAPAVAFAPG